MYPTILRLIININKKRRLQTFSSQRLPLNYILLTKSWLIQIMAELCIFANAIPLCNATAQVNHTRNLLLFRATTKPCFRFRILISMFVFWKGISILSNLWVISTCFISPLQFSVAFILIQYSVSKYTFSTCYPN